MLKKLPYNLQSSLRSTVIIDSYQKCVEEIVTNSLDAGAKNINVFVDLNDTGFIEISDDGRCMTYDELTVVGDRYCTTKLHESGRSLTTEYHGYRGESLASIRDICKTLKIRCLTGTHDMVKEFHGGKLAVLKVCPIKEFTSRKTVVSVTHLFHKIPVRHKSMNRSFVVESIKRSVEFLILINYSVSFVLELVAIPGLPGQILKKESCGSILEAATMLLGGRATRNLEKVEVCHGGLRLEGFVGLDVPAGEKVEYLYLNKKPVDCSDALYKIILTKFNKIKMDIRFFKDGVADDDDVLERLVMFFILNLSTKSKTSSDFVRCIDKIVQRTKEKLFTSHHRNNLPQTQDLDRIADKLLEKLEDVESPGMFGGCPVEEMPVADDNKPCMAGSEVSLVDERLTREASSDEFPAVQPMSVFTALKDLNGEEEGRCRPTFVARDRFGYSEFQDLDEEVDGVGEDVGRERGVFVDQSSSLSSSSSFILPNVAKNVSLGSYTSSSSSSAAVAGLMGMQSSHSDQFIHLDPEDDFKIPTKLATAKKLRRCLKSNFVCGLATKLDVHPTECCDTSSDTRGTPTTFTKDMFSNIQVIGQLDKKFIACLVDLGNAKADMSNEVILLVDQHAADERVRLEKLLGDVWENVSEADDDDGRGSLKMKSKPCLPPVEILVMPRVAVSMETCRPILRRNGISFLPWKQRDPDEGNPPADDLVVMVVTDAPICFHASESQLLELIGELLERRESPPKLPRPIYNRLCSVACHGAIKFGDKLEKMESLDLVRSLGGCDLPFQCAHGRPTTLPVLELRGVRRNLAAEVLIYSHDWLCVCVRGQYKCSRYSLFVLFEKYV